MFWIKYIRRENSVDADAVLFKPAGSVLVMRRRGAAVVRAPVDLDAQAHFRAEEIENVWPDWVLSPEAKASQLPVPELPPQDNLRQRHLPAQAPRTLEGDDRSAHLAAPSTMLRMVPL
ncbi:MAG: hypothetical protein JWQ89_4442, partial [Devosia sp.]|nr:hypothetical protein [Devosia sp.]